MSTSIEWCDETWNPVVGCTRVSAGCDHCYAMGVAHRKMSPQHVGLTKLRPRDAKRPGVDWTGEVRGLPERLAEPLRWRRPRRVFVNSMSDLFHERLPFEFIAAVFGVMASAPRHTFLVLTKRPARAVEFFAWVNAWAAKSPQWPNAAGWVVADAAVDELDPDEVWRIGGPWPLPNVHLGVSAEDQATWDERVPLLLQCPAAVRCMRTSVPCTASRSPLDWIVVGGESGPGARTCRTNWIRYPVEQCRAASVPVFVKQLGAAPREYIPPSGAPDDGGDLVYLRLQDRKGGDMSEWPADLRVRELPEGRHA